MPEEAYSFVNYQATVMGRTLVGIESLSHEDQVRLRVDAVYLEQRELKNMAELISKLLGG